MVDDDPLVRQLLRLHLAAAGYRVETAEDAVTGGHAIVRSPPDLLICDVQMPHMDGIAFVEAIRADASLPKFPVLFLSGEDGAAERGAALGARAFLAKPILKDRLLAAIRQALRV